MADDLCANEGRRLWIPARTSLGRTTGIKKAGRARRFRRSMPPWKARYPGGAEHSTRAEELLLQLLLLGFLGLLRLLRLLRFLSHSILSGFNGWKRDTRHARRRASLATSSNAIPTDSQARAPHCHVAVIALSTAVMHFWCVFVPSMRSALQKIARASDHRAASTGLTMRQRDGAGRIDREQPRALAPIFINSQPRRGLLRRGESPLSATAATYP
jgi:hypothetical protein